MINSVCWRGLAVDIIRRLWDHGYWRDNETLQRIHDEWLHFWVDYRTEKTMEDVDRQIKELQQEGDSCGGVIECLVKNVPSGLGMPVFDKLEADLAKALMSLPATKGFEIGSGFLGTYLRGSEHNDSFVQSDDDNKLKTISNNSGGIQGGISNGENIEMKIAFKPTATIGKEQKTVNADGQEVVMKAKGRHDPCVLPRAVPMVDSMVALVLADHLLRHHAQCSIIQ